MTEAAHDALKARLERAEGILRTLEHGEVDAILGRNGPGLLRSMDVIGRENQVKLALEELAKARTIELEIARKSKEAADAANISKSVFLSNMSHELRTPLNAILGFSQLMAISVPPPTDAQIERLGQISKAGWYLLELINEILDLSLIESDRLSLSPESLSLKQVVLECKNMIEPLAQKRDIKLIFPQFDNPCFVRADRIRLKQVLINLLSNAIKYNRDHGTVEVRCEENTPGRIRINIKDSGVGLSPEKLAQLFQPFNRLGQENSGVEGAGIGLMVTKRLVDLMEGSIGVESVIGEGCEFWIELPQAELQQLADEAALPAEFSPQVQENHGQYTLLYVEDNPANLMLIEQIIEGHPRLSMMSARDGNQGVALAQAHLPDVILMDINLPGISGIEAMNILYKDPATKHIPIIALSAHAMLHDIEKGLEAGFFRYLTKPIKINELLSALDEALAIAEKEN